MKTHYIKRDIEGRIRHYLSQFPAVALTGARQCGKTTTLNHALDKSYEFFTFDDYEMRLKAKEDMGFFFLKDATGYVFDEVQYVPELFSYIKMLIDREPSVRGKFVFTGSQHFLLMKSFSETLAGRIGILNMPTLTINEINAEAGAATEKELFFKVCDRGTYPRPVADKSTDIEEWYENYVRTYLERDVKSLYNVGKISEFNAFLSLLASRVSQVLNLSSFASALGVTVNTIKSWISILEASDIILLLRPYALRMTSKMTKNPKVYFKDTGLVCALNRIHGKTGILKSRMFGQIFENYCVSETIKIAVNRGVKCGFSFFRTHEGLEIDLLVENDGRIFPMEFKAASKAKPDMAESIERTIARIKNEKISEGFVVTLDESESKLSANVFSSGLNAVLKKVLSK